MERRRRPHGCWGHLIVAPLWVAYKVNLGTLLRTCDAAGACMAVPATSHYRTALSLGDTLKYRPHIHWVNNKVQWIELERQRGSRVVAVEIDDHSIPLSLVEPARERTVVLLGNERSGIPPEVTGLLDEIIEVPMVGTGHSLNVVVAASLALYRLAGLL